MEMHDRISSDLGPPTLYHAVSQGALAIEVRGNDEEAIELCKRLTHWQTQYRCLAERACLRVLEGGCSVPVGVFTILEEDASTPRCGELTLTGCVTSLDGATHVEQTLTRRVMSATDAEELGIEIAKTLLKDGARNILDEIKEDRARRVLLTSNDE